MASFKDWISKNAKSNASGLGGAGLGLDAAVGLASGESKLKLMLKVIRDLVIGTALWNVTMAGAFLAMGKGIRSLVHDTGSLQAALDKLRKIQGLQKLFEPLVGGAKAAKLEVAKLVNFAASKNLKLGEVAEGARSLKILTRDAFSGAQALSTIADAAAGTGSSFTEMADAVGGFSNTLRSGGSVSGASEQLRQMGAISQSTANQLNRMQESGSSNGEIFEALIGSLGRFSGQAEKAGNSIDGLNAKYEKAKVNLQEKFGSPFTESDIQNTKNWTDAMNAVAPVVQSISEFMAVLFNGLSNLSSWLAKTAGQSETMRDILTGLVKGFALLVAAVSAVAAVQLGSWLLATAAGMIGYTGATVVATVATRALAVAIASTGIGIFLVLIGTAVGIIMQWNAATERQRQAQQDLNDAYRESARLIQDQIDNIKTLGDQHDALTAALKLELDAQIALNKARLDGSPEGIRDAEANLANAKAKAEEARSKSGLAPTTREQQEIRDQTARDRQEKEDRYQKALDAASPAEKRRMLGEHAAEFGERSARGSVGLKAAAEADRQKQQADTDVKDADEQKRIAQEKMKGLMAEADKAGEEVMAISNEPDYNPRPYGDDERRGPDGRETRLEAAQAKARSVYGLQTDAGSEEIAADKKGKQARMDRDWIGSDPGIANTSTGLRYAQRKANEEGDPKRAAELGLQSEKALQEEQATGQNQAQQRDDLAAQKAMDRERMLNEAQENHDKDRLDAQVSGDAERIRDLDNAGRYAAKQKELVAGGMDQEEASKRAREFSDSSISLDYRKTAMSTDAAAAVSSLAKIGGGGGVEQVQNDTVGLLRQQLQAANKAVEWLEEIAKIKFDTQP